MPLEPIISVTHNIIWDAPQFDNIFEEQMDCLFCSAIPWCRNESTILRKFVHINQDKPIVPPLSTKLRWNPRRHSPMVSIVWAMVLTDPMACTYQLYLIGRWDKSLHALVLHHPCMTNKMPFSSEQVCALRNDVMPNVYHDTPSKVSFSANRPLAHILDYLLHRGIHPAPKTSKFCHFSLEQA